MTYALLQRSLDDTIDRRAMEEASVVAPSIARADCALLHRELFGIVVHGLEQREALAFQAALRMRGLDTELVAESELPVLANPVRRMAVRFDGTAWWVTDVYGALTRYGMEDLVFVAAGVLGDRAGRETQFRLELFVAPEPYRMQWVLAPNGVLRFNDRPFTFREVGDLLVQLTTVRATIPTERMNRGLEQCDHHPWFLYPSERAFEEEIVWRFYRLTHGQTEVE